MIGALLFFTLIFWVFTPCYSCCTRWRGNLRSVVPAGDRRDRGRAAARGRSLGIDGEGRMGREERGRVRGSEDGDVELPVYEPSPVVPPPAYCVK